jgi:hypothetical protein
LAYVAETRFLQFEGLGAFKLLKEYQAAKQ